MPIIGNLFLLNEFIERDPKFSERMMPPPPCPPGEDNPWKYWTPSYNVSWILSQVKMGQEFQLVGSPNYFLDQLQRAANPKTSLKATLQMEILLLLYSGYDVVRVDEVRGLGKGNQIFVLQKVREFVDLLKFDTTFHEEVNLLGMHGRAAEFWNAKRVSLIRDFLNNLARMMRTKTSSSSEDRIAKMSGPPAAAASAGSSGAAFFSFGGGAAAMADTSAAAASVPVGSRGGTFFSSEGGGVAPMAGSSASIVPTSTERVVKTMG